MMFDSAVLSLTGKNVASFLQGVCTADVQAWASHTTTAPLFTCHLSPKGRVVGDFYVFKNPENSENPKKIETLHLQCHSQALMPLAESMHVYNVDQSIVFHDATADITLPSGRELLAKHVAGPLQHMPCSFTDGVLSGARALPAELGLTHLAMGSFKAVSFKKGCYVGQEVTTRLHHLGQSKRQLMFFETSGNFTEAPTTGDLLENERGKTVGHIGATWQTENRVQGRALMKVLACDEAVYLRGAPVQLSHLSWLPKP